MFSMTVLSNKVSYKGFDTKSSLLLLPVCVFSSTQVMLLFSAEEMGGLENATSNLGFLWVRRKHTCLLIQGLSGNNGLSTYNFFPFTCIYFFFMLISEFEFEAFLAPLDSKLQGLKSVTIPFIFWAKNTGRG